MLGGARIKSAGRCKKSCKSTDQKIRQNCENGYVYKGKQSILSLLKDDFYEEDSHKLHTNSNEKMLESRSEDALHSCYQEKSIFPSYKAKLNLTLFSFENLITDT